jgi:hypothetical protein
VAGRPLTDEEKFQRWQIIDAHGGNFQQASLSLGLDGGSLWSWAQKNPKRERADAITFPVFLDEELPAEKILEHHAAAFRKRAAAAKSRKWFTINANETRPIAFNWFGDPHLGANGCNVDLLMRDVALVAKTPGMFGANIGDTVDNWSGKLVKLYAENDVSRKTERKLARWFLKESGVRWAVWLEGNHDLMDGEFSTHLRTLNAKQVPMMDWRAQFVLQFPNGKKFKIDAAHNHKGHSMWNELHGQERASVLEEDADLFIAGHHHTWAYKVKELADGRVVTLARVRGYKFIDSHAERWQFPTQQQGASGVTIFDPITDSPTERIRFYADVQAGVDKLTYLRAKYSAKGKAA